VSSELDGQAKAVAEQKHAMNVKTVVSSDNFGDIAEGNIGEFLKYLPGSRSTSSRPTPARRAWRSRGALRLRHARRRYHRNSTATGFGGDTRQFEFEAVSINNVESIEVYKTLSADMPGDAPAGVVNLRSKSALDRKGPASITPPSDRQRVLPHLSPHRASRRFLPREDPADGDFRLLEFLPRQQARRGGQRHLHQRLQAAVPVTNTHDYTSAQAIAAGTPLITLINYKDGPKMTEKSSGGLKLDYQPFRPCAFR